MRERGAEPAAHEDAQRARGEEERARGHVAREHAEVHAHARVREEEEVDRAREVMDAVVEALARARPVDDDEAGDHAADERVLPLPATELGVHELLEEEAPADEHHRDALQQQHEQAERDEQRAAGRLGPRLGLGLGLRLGLGLGLGLGLSFP